MHQLRRIVSFPDWSAREGCKASASLLEKYSGGLKISGDYVQSLSSTSDGFMMQKAGVIVLSHCYRMEVRL